MRLTHALPLLALLLAGAPALAQDEGNALVTKLEAMAAEGNGEAAYHLGMAYDRGLEGLEKDQQKAFELFRQSAESGDPLGAFMLGSYYDGEGGGAVEADPAQALKYKLIAADAGHAIAQHDVARMFYEQGDTAKTVDYLERSARQGYTPSLEALASLHSGEGKIAKDPVKVYAYVALLHGRSGGKPTKRLEDWRDKARTELSEQQLAEAMVIVAKWKMEPSALTKKALSGEAAAKQLAGLAPPPAKPRKPDPREAAEGR